ncbi:MAG: helix-turn-helix domain-containing protein [Akkermansiaceae bacterium]|nr:helix-turn-helix domain-containing protein [Akkermansiaceae bacterium]
MSRACNTACWKQVVIAHIAAGDNKVQAARAAGVNRRTISRWLCGDIYFAMDLDEAWDKGAKRRDYMAWYNHPFRGRRPPTGRGTRAMPRYGR